jgi:cell division protein YceG involved in septum cleavage
VNNAIQKLKIKKKTQNNKIAQNSNNLRLNYDLNGQSDLEHGTYNLNSSMDVTEPNHLSFNKKGKKK